jgi:phosphoenolpyruvate synthase/pyruvate phosphate dikinase
VSVLWLGTPACHDLASVGGKTARLSQLAADYEVPPGFCLPVTAFDHRIAAQLARDTWDVAIRERVHVSADVAVALALPEALREGVSTAYEALAIRCGQPEPSVAVRSSAVDEDGATASFAGQHETYLNIAGADAVATAVAACWASALAPRALEYRRQQGLAIDQVQLAVLVQQLVSADVSAVVFSANPVTGDLDEVMITASWGLGESIVGGTVTPDTYIVRKSNRTIVGRVIGEKRRMTVAVPGGTKEVETPRFLRTKPALEDGEILAAAQLAIDLEQGMGWPVDIECAFQATRLYLLQCRPVTALRTSIPR